MGPDDEYISRRVLKERLTEDEFLQNTDELYCALEIVDEMPAADVAPVKHGKWLNRSRTPYVKCSLCGGTVATNWRGRFCQNCGAVMKEEGKVFRDGNG